MTNSDVPCEFYSLGITLYNYRTHARPVADVVDFDKFCFRFAVRGVETNAAFVV